MRYWSEQEAREYLPRLKRLLEVIQRATRLAVSARGNGHANLPGGAAVTGPPDAEEAARELLSAIEEIVQCSR